VACPDLEQLEQYLSSELDNAWRRRLTDHMARCDECSSRLYELQENRRLEAPVRDLLKNDACVDTSPPREIGAYRVVRELGRGGMGVVYEAEQRSPRRRVAIKLLSPIRGANGSGNRLLRREAQALARLKHPSIAAIYEAGQTAEGRPFLVMELVDGESLLSHAQRRRLSLTQRLDLFARVCESVAYAHQRGVIHRDLKPANVLVVDGEGSGFRVQGSTALPSGQSAIGHRQSAIPKILDFGLARIYDLEGDQGDPQAPPASCVTEVGRVFGTLPYMSPEHVRGDPHEIDVRSDVYSLGVMLYELLTGRLPYAVDRTNLAQSARAIVEQTPAPPSSTKDLGVPSASLRGDIDTIVLKALEKAPERRYASAADLAADIHRHLRREPITARPPTAWYQLSRFAARNRALVGTVAASIVLLVVATAVAIGQAYVATRERDAAQRRLAYATHTADYVFKGVANQLGRIAGSDEVRRHIAEEAYVFYKRLADESPDDLAAQADLWHVMRSLALDAIQLGNLERADLIGGQVFDLVERATAQHGDDPLIMRQLAHTHAMMGALHSTRGNVDEARAFERRSVEMRLRVADWYETRLDPRDPQTWVVADTGPLAGHQPSYVKARFDRASAYVWMAQQAMGPRDPGRRSAAGSTAALGDRSPVAEGSPDLRHAETHALAALQILQELSEIDPTRVELFRQDTSEYAPLAAPISLRKPSGPGYERLKAATHTLLADIARARGDQAEAERRYRTAVDVAEQVRATWPDELANLAAVAAAHAALADYLAEAGDAAGAQEHGLVALDHHQRLSQAQPTNRDWPQAILAHYELLLDTSVSVPSPHRAEWEQAARDLRGRPAD